MTRVANAAALVALAVGCAATADGFDDVMALVPRDATWAIVVPKLSKATTDLAECIARMDRKESDVFGRPIDHVRAFLGAREGFDENGPFAAWALGGDPAQEAVLVLIPAADPAAYIAAHPDKAEDGTLRFGGEAVHARALEHHVLASRSKAAVEAFAAGDGLAKIVEQDLGARGIRDARDADMVAWISASATASQTAPLKGPLPGLGDLRKWISASLVLVDIDPLGLSVRSRTRVAEGSMFATLASRCQPLADQGGRDALAGLHTGAFLVGGAANVRALGGGESLRALAELAGATDAMPAWLADDSASIDAVRFACYPSKLGILAGGVLNDSTLVVESPNPSKLRDAFKAWVLGQVGVHDGVRREPSWEDGRALKDGTVADAYEIKGTPLGPSEAQGVDMGQVAMRQMMAQAMFGPRGAHGFVKVLPGALVVTCSQRPDVLARALAAQGEGECLSDDAVIASMQPWLVKGAQVEAYISLGQLLKAVRQLADVFGGVGASLPNIPTRSAPVALSFKASPEEVEMSAMIPTPVLSAIIDQSMGAMTTSDSAGKKARE